MADSTNAPPAPDPETETKRPQLNVRLAPVARENLARLQAFYGTNATATLSFVLAEAVRRLPPSKPFALPSPDVNDEDALDLEARHLGQPTG